MKPYKRRKPNKKVQDSGVVILEFAMVLPTVLLFVFASLEISRTLQKIEIATAISLEAATMVFTETTLSGEYEYSSPTDQQQAFRNQLQKSLKTLQQHASRMSNGAEIVVSRFALKADDSGLEVRSASLLSLNGRLSRFSISGKNVTNGDLSITLDAQRPFLVIAEVFVPFTPLAPGLFLVASIEDGVYYDATII